MLESLVQQDSATTSTRLILLVSFSYSVHKRSLHTVRGPEGRFHSQVKATMEEVASVIYYLVLPFAMGLDTTYILAAPATLALRH